MVAKKQRSKEAKKKETHKSEQIVSKMHNT